MVILKAMKYRIYPTKAQAELLEKQFGCARFVYNRFLAVRREYYLAHKDDPQKNGLNYYDTAAQLKELKKQPEYAWLKEAHSQVLQPCHYINPDMPLSIREWDCPVCGVHHDRDLNAAQNILEEALTRAGSARSHAEGVSVSPIFGLAVHAELGSHPL